MRGRWTARDGYTPVALRLEDQGRDAYRQPRFGDVGQLATHGDVPDDYLVCLDARTGKERWHVEIANFSQQYFSTMGARL